MWGCCLCSSNSPAVQLCSHKQQAGRMSSREQRDRSLVFYENSKNTSWWLILPEAEALRSDWSFSTASRYRSQLNGNGIVAIVTLLMYTSLPILASRSSLQFSDNLPWAERKNTNVKKKIDTFCSKNPESLTAASKSPFLELKAVKSAFS